MRPSRHLRTRRGPIVILDSMSRHTVAAVRGLGRAGWDVVVAGSGRPADSLAARSRYAVGPYERLPDAYGEAAPFEAALTQLVRRRGCQAIVAVSDASMARLRSLDLAVPTVPRLDAGFDRVIDKAGLAAVCAEAGVMYPETWLPEHAPADAGWPRIVKPRRTAIARPDGVVERTGAFVVHDDAAERSALAELRALGLEPLVQKRVQRAGKVNVSIVRSAGRTSFRIAYRVLLEQPPQGGQAAAVIGIDPFSGIGARALDAAERVCDAAGYNGLANVEFYRQEDGEPCLLEVNPRVWGSAWFPERLGLRPVERAVLDALGESPPAARDYPVGRRFHRPILEGRWLLAPRRERGPAWTLLSIVRPWDVFDLLSVTDPLPFALGLRRILARSREELTSRADPPRR